MSLLMEALRKAEDAKRKSLEQETSAAASAIESHEPGTALRQSGLFSLEPREIKAPEPFRADQLPADTEAPAAEPAPEPETLSTLHSDVADAPEVDTSRDEIQDYFAAEPTPEDNSPPPRPGRKKRDGRQSRDQLAAASVFAAKRTAPDDARRRARLATLLSVGLVLCIAGGTGLWWILNPSTSGLGVNPGIANYDAGSRGFLDEQPAVGLASTAEADAAPAEALVASAPDPVARPESAPVAVVEQQSASITTPEQAVALAAAAVASNQARNEATNGAALVPAAVAVPAPDPTPAAVAAATTSPTTTAAASAEAVPATRANRTLEITRSTGRSVVNSTVQTAWETLQNGDSQTASLLYQEVLAERPNNRDALIGLASIRLRDGQFTVARQLYAQLLTLNPQDPYARAGFLQATQADNDPAYEGELRNLLQLHPELAPLHFALGNYHAGQQRWSEAQAAYFNALLYANRDGSTAASPDYAFNLAVSLEQLQQPEAALNYYRQALQLSRSSSPGFDPALLQGRLAQLEQSLP